VTTDELKVLFERLGEPVPGYQLREMIAEVDTGQYKRKQHSSLAPGSPWSPLYYLFLRRFPEGKESRHTAISCSVRLTTMRRKK
jgi:hypothetical protein